MKRFSTFIEVHFTWFTFADTWRQFSGFLWRIKKLLTIVMSFVRVIDMFLMIFAHFKEKFVPFYIKFHFQIFHSRNDMQMSFLQSLKTRSINFSLNNQVRMSWRFFDDLPPIACDVNCNKLDYFFLHRDASFNSISSKWLWWVLIIGWVCAVGCKTRKSIDRAKWATL